MFDGSGEKLFGYYRPSVKHHFKRKFMEIPARSGFY